MRAVAGGCGLLVTTRNRTQAEARCLDVEPLPLPDALTLLNRWAGTYAPAADVARAICELVGRLPLAVRLAGRYLDRQHEPAAEYLAWLRETPLTALDHGDRREQSVPLLLEKSLAQVGDTARQILAVAGRLALARSSAYAWTVALGYTNYRELRRPMAELVDYGLLLREHNYYELSHALIHTYARRRLRVEAETLARLAGHYTDLAEREQQRGAQGHASLAKIRPHVMALLPHLQEARQWAPLLEMTQAVVGYLDIRGYTADLLVLAEAALAAARSARHRVDEGAWLNSVGYAYTAPGRVEESIGYYEGALTISRGIGDRQGEGTHLGNLGTAYYSLGRAEEAIGCYEQALVIRREIGERRGEGADLDNLGIAYTDLGDLQKAIDLHEQALALRRQIRDRRGESADLNNLGLVYFSLGHVEKAIRYYKQALVLKRETGDRLGEGIALNNLGEARQQLGQAESARERLDEALVIAQETGYRALEGNALGNLGLLARSEGRAEEAANLLARAVAILEEARPVDATKYRETLAELTDSGASAAAE